MSTYEVPQEVLDSLAPTESEQQEDTSDGGSDEGKTADDSQKGKTADDTGTNDAKGNESEGDEGESNELSDKGKSEGDDTEESAESQEPTSVKLKGKEYSLEDLETIVTEHQEDTDWKKSNTEKAQTLAAQSKAIEGVTGVLEKILADPDALEILEDMGYKLDPKALSTAKEAAKDAQTTPVREEEASDDLKQMKAKLDEITFREALRDFTTQDEEHQKVFDTPKKVQEFVKFLVEHNQTDFNKAYNLFTQADRLEAAEEALEKEKEGKGGKTKPKAPVGQGAKNIKTGFKPVSGDFGFDAARGAAEKILSSK